MNPRHQEPTAVPQATRRGPRIDNRRLPNSRILHRSLHGVNQEIDDSAALLPCDDAVSLVVCPCRGGGGKPPAGAGDRSRAVGAIAGAAAAVSLARLWRSQGRRDEARELLTGIYGWFTEGFDSPDLVEAKALLEQLG